MQRYRECQPGNMLCSVDGEYVKWDDVVEKLFLVQMGNQETLTKAEEAITEAIREVRQLRKELQQGRVPPPKRDTWKSVECIKRFWTTSKPN